MKKVLLFMFIVFLTGSGLFPDGAGTGSQKIPKTKMGRNQQIQKESAVFEKKVVFWQILEMRSLVSGKVSEVMVKVTDRVSTGQLLFSLNSPTLENEIIDAEESIKKWKEVLYKREHWKARSERAENQARAKIEEFENKLKEKTESGRKPIYSLIDGKIVDVVQEGMEVGEESIMVRIGDDSNLKVELTAGEAGGFEWVRRLQDGGKISMIFSEINLACSGELIRREDKIVIRIPNEKFLISPGMVAKFTFAPDDGGQIQTSFGDKEAAIDLPGKSGKKKIEVEACAGLSYSDPGDYYYRFSGIDSLMNQYIGNYGVDYTASGSFPKNIYYIPIQALINYPVSGKWYLKAGLEFGYGNDSPGKTFNLDWGEVSEEYRYDLSSQFTYFMPFVGGETRFSRFGIYANAGYGFLHFSHELDYQYSGGSLWLKENDQISANGSGLGILVGGKYSFKLGKKLNCLVKLELAYLRIGNLKGSRDSSHSSSSGADFYESVNGTIYSFETNPYDLGWFYYWELYESAPSGSDVRNVQEMILNLSSIRLMIGFVF